MNKEAPQELDGIFKRGALWSLDNRNVLLRSLKTGATALKRGGGVTAKLWLGHLSTIEIVALRNPRKWAPDPEMEDAQNRFLMAFRDSFGPSLKSMPDSDTRRNLNELLGKMESFLGIPDPYCRPSRGRIELTNQCNLRCAKCPQSVWKWKRHYATRSAFERAQTLIPWLDFLDLTSVGEVFLSPLFEDYLSAVPPRVHTYLNTNGILIDENVAKILVAHPPSEIHVSIDAANPETYKKFRGANAFEKVLKNCRGLQKLKSEAGASAPRLYLNTTIEIGILDEILPLIRLAKEIGFQGVVANYLMVWKSEDRMSSIYWAQEETREVLARGDRLAGELGIEFHHFKEPHPEDEGKVKRKRFCREPWQSIHTLASGHVATCNLNAEMYEAPESTTWEDIWDGPGYRSLRERVNLEGEGAPPICRDCCLCGHLLPGDRRFHFMDEAFVSHTGTDANHFWLSPDLVPKNVLSA